MKALQLSVSGGPPVLVNLPVPNPGPGEIRLRVLACGLCHTDLRLAGSIPPMYEPPYVLGHEIVGVVDSVGDGVAVLDDGPYAVFGPQGCNRCARCASGEENLCKAPPHGPGRGVDGGMAEYVLVSDARHLIPIGDLDPVKAAPLTDAGLSPYHAITRSRNLLAPGSTAVVIGVGGLGHLAIQILRTLTGARIVAIDVHPDKLQFARALGADAALPAGEITGADVRANCVGAGADLVIDFVGRDETMLLGAESLRKGGQLKVMGGGGGAVPFSRLSVAPEASLTSSFWGTRGELFEVLALAQRGSIETSVEQIGFEDLLAGLERLAAGHVPGRLVLVPDLEEPS